MDYYKTKLAAYRVIDRMYADGCTRADIIYGIACRFGFGKKLVEDRIDSLEERGFAKVPVPLESERSEEVKGV